VPVAVKRSSSRDFDIAHPANGLDSARGEVGTDGLPCDTEVSCNLGDVAHFLVVSDQVIYLGSA